MVENLARLAADSLPVLRDEKLIDDGILDIVPYDEAQFSEPSDRSHISFKPFYAAIKDKLKTDTLVAGGRWRVLRTGIDPIGHPTRNWSSCSPTSSSLISPEPTALTGSFGAWARRKF